MSFDRPAAKVPCEEKLCAAKADCSPAREQVFLNRGAFLWFSGEANAAVDAGEGHKGPQLHLCVSHRDTGKPGFCSWT